MGAFDRFLGQTGGGGGANQWNMAAGAARYGSAAQGSLGGVFFGGMASAVAPVEPMPWLVTSEARAAARERVISSAGAPHPWRKGEYLDPKLSKWERLTTRGTRTAVRKAGRVLSKWAGPLITGYRLGTEVDPGRQGVGGAISKTGRIIGEEALSTGAFAVGLGVIGGAIGTAVAPVVGTAVGGAIGLIAGGAIGLIGSEILGKQWNRFMDVAETPFRMAHAGWKFLEKSGKQNRMELGGGISRGNRTRAAYTMRARALQQMNRSGINARSLLGQEAAYMHIR